jgi:hypothetical protein
MGINLRGRYKLPAPPLGEGIYFGYLLDKQGNKITDILNLNFTVSQHYTDSFVIHRPVDLEGNFIINYNGSIPKLFDIRCSFQNVEMKIINAYITCFDELQYDFRAEKYIILE